MKTYKFKINGNEYNVDINSVEGNIADVTVNGASYKVEMDGPSTSSGSGAQGGPSAGSVAAVAGAGSSTGSAPSTGSGAVKAGSGAGVAVTSPLPGVIIEISVKEGQAVKAGQKVAVIEAMKMENEIQAPSDGTVTAVLVNKGDSVLEGAEIVKIA